MQLNLHVHAYQAGLESFAKTVAINVMEKSTKIKVS